MKVLCVFTLCVMVLVLGQTLTGPKHDKKVVCYIASWAGYRPEPGKYTIEDLEPSLCTHLVYSFAGLDETTNSIKSLDPWQDLETNYGLAGYKRLVALKETYPHLKVTLAIGGWNERSPKYSEMASKPESRAAFIASVLKLLSDYNFDGLDLDLVYPSNNDGKLNDRENFVTLVKELSQAFKPQDYILTAAIGAGKSTMDIAYDMNQYLDLIHLMCYDYHGSWERVLGANAPLRGRSKDDVSSVEYTINYMINRGVPPSKLVIGLPMYGRTFYLVNPDVKVLEFGSTLVKEIGFNGPLTGQAGFMGYLEICMETSNASSPWKYHWHEQASIPYLRDGGRVITYDNGRSIAIKAKMAIEKGLGGLMVWSVDTDDYKGNCKETDAYVDFEERFQRMVYDPLSRKAAENLNLPDITEAPIDGPSYVLKDNQLHFRLPQPKLSNYALMQTINDAMTLSLEEKRIEEEMARITKENEVNILLEDNISGSSSMMRVFLFASPGKIDRRVDGIFQEGRLASFLFD